MWPSPRRSGILLLYIGWVLLSATQLDKRHPRYLVFAYRFSAYLCALLLLIYVFNERRVTREWIAHKIGLFWIFCIIGAYVGLIIPSFRFPVTLASMVFPKGLQSNEFLGDAHPARRRRRSRSTSASRSAAPRPSSPSPTSGAAPSAC